MPTYDYRCGHCGDFEALRRIAEREAPLRCPTCGDAASRTWLAAARIADMDPHVREAMATNERARHEPRRSRDEPRLAHPSGCGCCGARRATTAANGMKSAPSKRPWMISH